MTTITRNQAPAAVAAAAALVPLPAVNECDRLYTVAEAAALLSVSASYIRLRIAEGQIEVTDLSDGKAKLRISATDLTNFILARKEKS